MSVIKIRELKKYFELLYLFCILIIITACLALNRLCHGIVSPDVCFGQHQYVLRNIIEHGFTSLFVPFFALFLAYSVQIIICKFLSKDFRFFEKGFETLLMVVGSILYLLLESVYQIQVNYNSASWYQILTSFVFLALSNLFIYWRLKK